MGLGGRSGWFGHQRIAAKLLTVTHGVADCETSNQPIMYTIIPTKISNGSLGGMMRILLEFALIFS